MNTRTRKNCLVVLTLSATFVLSSAFLTTQLATWKRPVTHAGSSAQSHISSISIDYSDCLWYTARNNGFYQVQKAVAQGQNDQHTRQLWQQFVRSAGEDACGPIPHSVAELTLAIAATEQEADEYFIHHDNTIENSDALIVSDAR